MGNAVFIVSCISIRCVSRHSGGTVSATDVSNVGIEMSGVQRKHINSPG